MVQAFCVMMPARCVLTGSNDACGRNLPGVHGPTVRRIDNCDKRSNGQTVKPSNRCLVKGEKLRRNNNDDGLHQTVHVNDDVQLRLYLDLRPIHRDMYLCLKYAQGMLVIHFTLVPAVVVTSGRLDLPTLVVAGDILQNKNIMAY